MRGSAREKWLQAARSRLRMELAGLAFALRRGYTPEEYAQELWGKGAVGWMGEDAPAPDRYIRREAEAMAVLYPWVKAKRGAHSARRAELVMERDCLAGWGEDRWATARRLGLARDLVCRYCQEAFRVWGRQLGLEVSPNPQADGTCLLRAEKKGE